MEKEEYNTVIDGTKGLETTTVAKPNFDHRGLAKGTLDFYGCINQGDSILLPYGKDAWVTRPYEQKQYRFAGDPSRVRLFGQDKFGPGQGETVTVYEGAYDAMSGYQMTNSKYAHVACRSVATAKNECSAQYDYLNSFNKIILCFDNDDPGRAASKKVAALFNPTKVFTVQLNTHKDANEYMVKGDVRPFVSLWWNAKKFKLDGIVGDYEDVEKILNRKDATITATYPFHTLQEKTYGIREGEVIVIKAQEKIGKTAFMYAIEHHLLKTTDHNLGLVHLEDTDKRTVQGLIGYELRQPVHLPDRSVSTEEQLEAYKTMTSRNDRLHILSHFGSDDPETILDAIRYLVTALECKYIFLDHITMIVTGHKDEGDERRKLDYISTKLAMMTKELGFTLFLVSHVNDNNQTRGSRNIAKVGDLIIQLDRDKMSADETIRNTTKVIIEGNRFAHGTGPAGSLFFDVNTYTLTEGDSWSGIENKEFDNSPFMVQEYPVPAFEGLPKAVSARSEDREYIPETKLPF